MKVLVSQSVWLFATWWTVARQAPLSRQEYWSVLPCPSPGDLPNPGIKLRSLALQTDSLPSEPPGKPQNNIWHLVNNIYWGFPGGSVVGSPLAMHGMPVQSLVWEDFPRCLCTASTEPALCNRKKSLWWEACFSKLGKAHMQQQRPSAAK